MLRPNWKSIFTGAILVAVLTLCATRADAFHRWGCYRPAYLGCGYGGYYAPCYTPYYTTCYTPYCSVGCSPCGYYGCYDSCATSCCTTPATVTVAPEVSQEPTQAKGLTEAPEAPTPPAPPAIPAAPEPPVMPVDPTPTPGLPLGPMPTFPPEPAVPDGLLPATPGLTPEPATSPEPPIMPGTSGMPIQDNSGLLSVFVPYDAKVTINGRPTNSRGSRRKFVSYGLKPGFSYKYVIRAEAPRDGYLVDETRTVYLTAGDHSKVAFGFTRDIAAELASR